MNSSTSERARRAGNRRSGGQILVDALRRLQSVDAVFCVPGESYLAALDAFHDAGDAIALYTCRHPCPSTRLG